MRWAPLHPRQMAAIAAAALTTMLLLMLLAAHDLGSLEFSLGAGTTDSGGSSAPIPQSAEVTKSPPPAWVTDPLAPPLGHFR